MNQNWIVENLNNAFSTWNGKLTELWGLVTTSPQTFKGGAVWGVMQSLHNALIGIIIKRKAGTEYHAGVPGIYRPDIRIGKCHTPQNIEVYISAFFIPTLSKVAGTK